MERVRLVHGNGGRFSHELTDKFILKYFTNSLLAPLHDGAQFDVPALQTTYDIQYDSRLESHGFGQYHVDESSLQAQRQKNQFPDLNHV